MRPPRTRAAALGTRRAAVVLIGLAGTCAWPAAASAASTPAPGGGLATFAGHTIDLADGWQGATACLVRASGAVQCFATRAELANALGGAGSDAAAAVPATTCGGGAVYLYQDANYGGAELALQNYGYWVNLADYGFADEMTSWINTSSCNATVATGTYGGGSHLGLGANSYDANVGSAWAGKAQSEEIS